MTDGTPPPDTRAKQGNFELRSIPLAILVAIIASEVVTFVHWRVERWIGPYGPQVLEVIKSVFANAFAAAAIGVVFAGCFGLMRPVSGVDLLRYRRKVALFLYCGLVPLMAVQDVVLGGPVVLNSLVRIGAGLLTLRLLKLCRPRWVWRRSPVGAISDSAATA